MSDKKLLNGEELEKVDGGYSPPEYDDLPLNPKNKKDGSNLFDGSKRDLDRIVHDIPTVMDGKGDPGEK